MTTNEDQTADQTTSYQGVPCTMDERIAYLARERRERRSRDRTPRSPQERYARKPRTPEERYALEFMTEFEEL